MPAIKHYRSAMRTKNVDTLWSPNSGLRYGKKGSQRWKERELKKAFNKIFSAWRLVLVDEWHRSRSPFCRPGVQFLEVMVLPIFFFCRHCCYYSTMFFKHPRFSFCLPKPHYPSQSHSLRTSCQKYTFPAIFFKNFRQQRFEVYFGHKAHLPSLAVVSGVYFLK